MLEIIILDLLLCQSRIRGISVYKGVWFELSLKFQFIPYKMRILNSENKIFGLSTETPSDVHNVKI
jgi:hypothetical protein